MIYGVPCYLCEADVKNSLFLIINKYKIKQGLSDNIDDETLVGLFANSKLEKLYCNIPNTHNNDASNINKLSK